MLRQSHRYNHDHRHKDIFGQYIHLFWYTGNDLNTKKKEKKFYHTVNTHSNATEGIFVTVY